MNRFIAITSLSLFMNLSACTSSDKAPEVTAPTVTTSPVTSVTGNSANCGGHVFYDANNPVTARGVVWDTTEYPTVSINQGMTTDGTGAGSFTSSITGLTYSTIYYVRSYATNSAGTSYGEHLSFTTACKTVDFTDENFKAYCVSNFDIDGDGEISLDEAKVPTSMEFCTDNIEDITGIKSFVNLKTLKADGTYHTPRPPATGGGPCGHLKSADLSGMTHLEELSSECNRSLKLNISGCVALRYVNVNSSCLSDVDFSSNLELNVLHCDSHILISLDLSNNKKLTELYCAGYRYGSLETLDISNCTALKILSCRINKLTALDVSQNTALTKLDCCSNDLLTLDVSNNLILDTLSCEHNPCLTEIWLKRGQTIKEFSYDSEKAVIYYKD